MNFLIDIIPATARKYVYGVLALLAFAYGTWQAADGDWRAALTALIAAAVNALAHANTNQAPKGGESE